MFQGSVKDTGYPLHSAVSPSLPLPCVTMCHHISTGLYSVQGTCRRVGTLLPIESRTTSSAHLYGCDSDMEAQINMRCCIMDGLDGEIAGTIQRVLIQVNQFVEIFLRRAGEFLRNQAVLKVRLTTHEAPPVDLRTRNCPARKRWLPFYFKVMWEPNETFAQARWRLLGINDRHPSCDPLHFPLLSHMVNWVGI